MSMVAKTRLYLTRDKTRLVKEGDPDAGYLFCTPGRTISDAECLMYGLEEEPEVKMAPVIENKSMDVEDDYDEDDYDEDDEDDEDE